MANAQFWVRFQIDFPVDAQWSTFEKTISLMSPDLKNPDEAKSRARITATKRLDKFLNKTYPQLTKTRVTCLSIRCVG